MFHRFGADVTILEGSEQLLPREEPQVGSTIAHVLADEGVGVLLRARVKAVRRTAEGVVLVADVANRRREVAAERLLVATGRRPNSDDIALEKAGVRTDEGGWVVVDETLKTSAAHVYAAGDVIGRYTGSQLVYPTMAEALKIVALAFSTDVAKLSCCAEG